jgi:hypothetical protein
MAAKLGGCAPTPGTRLPIIKHDEKFAAAHECASGPGGALIGHAIRIGPVTVRRSMDFAAFLVENRSTFENPVLFNGHPWSRNKTRATTSQVVATPP